MLIDPEGLESNPQTTSRTNPKCAKQYTNNKDNPCYGQAGHEYVPQATHPRCDSVIGHGKEGEGIDQREGEGNKPTDLGELAKEILEKNPDSECVVMFQCEAAKGGDNSVTKKLGEEMEKQSGRDIPVTGPEGSITPNAEGGWDGTRL